MSSSVGLYCKTPSTKLKLNRLLNKYKPSRSTDDSSGLSLWVNVRCWRILRPPWSLIRHGYVMQWRTILGSGWIQSVPDRRPRLLWGLQHTASCQSPRLSWDCCTQCYWWCGPPPSAGLQLWNLKQYTRERLRVLNEIHKHQDHRGQ